MQEAESTAGQGYIQVEGVNIYDTLGDTRQLSVIRGGSFLLKEAVEAVAEAFKVQLEAISTGASVGVFSNTTHIKSPDQLATLAHQIAERLNHAPWHCLTFAVVSHWRQAGEKYPVICAQLQALSRFQQLQQLNMAPDYLDGNSAPHSQVCTTDRFRPAGTSGESASVKTRYKKGLEGRRAFLQHSLGALHQLAAFGPDGCNEITLTRTLEAIGDNPDMGNLHNKLALVYVDGNSFGDIKQSHVHNATDQALFDTFLQTQRQALLDNWCAQLFERMKQRRNAFSQLCYQDKEHDEVQLRFEALLWGGDELLFVVPAWQGMALLSFLYQQTRKWCLTEWGDQRFQHAGGLVFCKANAPIFRIRDLAQQLADQVKERGGRDKDRFNYSVLESIDYPCEALEGFQQAQYGAALAAQNSGFDIPSPQALSQWPACLSQLPKGQIYQLAGAVYADGGLGPETARQQQRLQQLIGRAAWQALHDLLTDSFGADSLESGWCWVLLRELWDYLDGDFNAGTAPQPVEEGTQ